MSDSSDLRRIDLPIEDLAPGEIAPPLEPGHPSWAVLDGWDDPMAPRAGYNVSTHKERVVVDGEPALHFLESQNHERAMVARGPWRELAIECEMQALQVEAGPTNDDWQVDVARAGLVFRGETVRRHYFLCVEAMRRLVLYRRIDQEWHELAAQDVAYDGERVTLRVALDGDGIHAECPELGVSLMATDTQIASGHAGFRTLGEARLFRLSITCDDSRQAVTARHRVRSASPEELPDAVQVGELRLPSGYALRNRAQLRGPEDLRGDGAHNLLLHNPEEGLLATDWDGTELWRMPGPVGQIKVTTEPIGGSRRIYALVGQERSPLTNVRGGDAHWLVASQIVALDAANGEELARVEIPEDPNRDVVRQYDFSCETGRLMSDEPGDFLLRQWRTDRGHGGHALWAFNTDLEPLWQTEISPPYGHHYAVRLVDLTGDGRVEVVAGGTTLAGDGTVIAEHDLAHEMDEIMGAGHYDAVAVGRFSEDHARDPVAFFVAGSAGVYVTDPLTGRTRSVHRVGHAQGQQICRLRDDMPGKQVLVHTRWANFGILTLFSGLGERLWSIQPAYIPVARPVQWLAEGPQHLWACATRESLGLYDGAGRRVRGLPAVAEAMGDRPATKVSASVMRRAPEDRDHLALTIDDRVLLFVAEE